MSAPSYEAGGIALTQLLTQCDKAPFYLEGSLALYSPYHRSSNAALKEPVANQKSIRV